MPLSPKQLALLRDCVSTVSGLVSCLPPSTVKSKLLSSPFPLLSLLPAAVSSLPSASSTTFEPNDAAWLWADVANAVARCVSAAILSSQTDTVKGLVLPTLITVVKRSVPSAIQVFPRIWLSIDVLACTASPSFVTVGMLPLIMVLLLARQTCFGVDAHTHTCKNTYCSLNRPPDARLVATTCADVIRLLDAFQGRFRCLPLDLVGILQRLLSHCSDPSLLPPATSFLPSPSTPHTRGFWRAEFGDCPPWASLVSYGAQPCSVVYDAHSGATGRDAVGDDDPVLPQVCPHGFLFLCFVSVQCKGFCGHGSTVSHFLLLLVFLTY